MSKMHRLTILITPKLWKRFQAHLEEKELTASVFIRFAMEAALPPEKPAPISSGKEVKKDPVVSLVERVRGVLRSSEEPLNAVHIAHILGDNKLTGQIWHLLRLTGELGPEVETEDGEMDTPESKYKLK